MPLIEEPKAGFFRVALSWSEFKAHGEAFVADVKEIIGKEWRDYDDKDREWVFDEKHHSVIKTLLRAHFGNSAVEVV